MLTTPKSPLHAMMRAYGMYRLASDMGVSYNTVLSWVNKEHVPVSRITKLAHLLDIPLGDALDLIGKPKNDGASPTLLKPKGTLDLLLEVKRGNMTLEAVSEATNIPLDNLQRSYSLNEHRLPLLQTTLKAYADKRISRKEAIATLGVSKSQFHYLARTYGEVPKRVKRKKELGRYLSNRPLFEKLALEVIAGRTNARKLALTNDIPLRTLHRYIKAAIEPLSLTELSHWPMNFRRALALELEGKSPAVVKKLVALAQKHQVVLEKRVRPMETPKNLRELGAQDLARVILYGHHTVEEVALLRGGEVPVIKNLVNGALKPIGMRYSEVVSMSLAHQAAVADLLTMIGSHYRRGV
jgi:transcriptional regulator with XRE-family HTH domain